MKLELICEFTVAGKPASRGSKRAFLSKKTGKINLVDGKNSYRYMKDITACAKAAMNGRPPVDGPVLLEWVAHFKRPKSHYRKNGLREDAPREYTQTPDCSKVVRGIEDALSGVCYLDDKQVIGYAPTIHKVWTEGEPCTIVRLYRYT